MMSSSQPQPAGAAAGGSDLDALMQANIVRVFNEFSAFGTTFIAMELCDGPERPG